MRQLLGCAIAVALAAQPSVASASVTLLSQTDLPNQTNTPTSLNFVAGSNSTVLSVAGYNVPSFIDLTDIELTLMGASTNLLGQTFAFTPASSACTDASQSGPGAFGTNNLSLGSVCVGDNDIFSQTFATTIGASYTLSFLLSNSEVPNGLTITATDAVAAVPEPASWAMMLLGFAGMGFSLRYGRRIGRPSSMAT